MSGNSTVSSSSSASRRQLATQQSAPNMGGGGGGGGGGTTALAQDRYRTKVAAKDDMFRRKYEKEASSLSLNTPRKPGTGSGAPAVKGAVLRLKPNPPITVTEGITIAAAAKLMASKRSDSLIITPSGESFLSAAAAAATAAEDDDEPDVAGSLPSILAGIITDKDIAFRVVAQNLDANSTTVGQVMTPHPTFVSSTTDANEALLKMAQGRFRHLPVVDSAGPGGAPIIHGVLDIIKCLYSTITKLERAYESAKALYEATAAATSQWSGLEAETMLENLRQRMNCPPVSSVIDMEAGPPVVGPKATVREATKLMKQEHASAVLIVDNNKLVGIFTTKDIVLRVIGTGLDPDVTSIVRVMTPHPTSVGPDCTVLDALKKMQEGRYLHLPIVNSDQSVFGLVDVLVLTYSTLGQVDNVERGPVKKEPAWKTFWNASLAADEDNKGPIIGGGPPSEYSVGNDRSGGGGGGGG